LVILCGGGKRQERDGGDGSKVRKVAGKRSVCGEGEPIKMKRKVTKPCSMNRNEEKVNGGGKGDY